jgi:hypothetical protein
VVNRLTEVAPSDDVGVRGLRVESDCHAARPAHAGDTTPAEAAPMSIRPRGRASHLVGADTRRRIDGESEL